MIFPQEMTQEDIFTALHSLAFGSLAHVRGREHVLSYDAMMNQLKAADRRDALTIVEDYMKTRGYKLVERVATWVEFSSQLTGTALAVSPHSDTAKSGYAIRTHAGHIYKSKDFDVFGVLMFMTLEFEEVPENEKNT